MLLEEHYVVRSLQSGLCVYDSRGLDSNNMEESLEELSSWMNDGVHHNQLCLRSGDHSLPRDELDILTARSSSKFVRRKVNCAMVVADVAEIYNAYKAGDYKPLEATKELFCSPAFKKCGKVSFLFLSLKLWI